MVGNTSAKQDESASSSDIPKEQWAMVIEKTGGPVEYKKIPVQKPGPDEVLVNIKFSGGMYFSQR
jgi:hypothetical protein